MSMTAPEYQALAARLAPKSKPWVNVPKAFFTGGCICAIGQGLILLYTGLGLPADTASGACSMTLVALSALLTGLGVYDRLARHAGAGTLVPITGFANSVVSPALEFKNEGCILGIAAKMFVIAGPVLVYGLTASVVYGVLLCLGQLVV